MADIAQLITRIRSHGANVIMDSGRLRIINKDKLPDGALDFVTRHGKELAAFLDQEAEFEERAAIIEYDGGLNRAAAEQVARLLLSRKPDDVEPADWTWFVGKAIRIMDTALDMRAAA